MQARIKACAHAPIAAASLQCASIADPSVCGPFWPVWLLSCSARRRGRSHASAEIPAITQRQRTEKKAFTDSEILEGFFKTAFGAEYHLAGRVDRIRKYDAPVRVFADGARPDRKAQIGKIVADIAARVQHLDIAMAANNDEANVLVKLVRDRDLYRTITTFYGSERAREIRSLARSAMPERLPQEREIRNRAFRRDPHRR